MLHIIEIECKMHQQQWHIAAVLYRSDHAREFTPSNTLSSMGCTTCVYCRYVKKLQEESKDSCENWKKKY